MDKATVSYSIGLFLSVALVAFAIFFAWKRRGTEGQAEATLWGLSFRNLSITGLMLVLGVVGGAASIVKLAAPTTSTANVQVGHVSSLENVPASPDLESGSDEDKEERFANWLVAWYDDVEIIVDQGQADGIQNGDYFVTIANEERAKGLPKEDVANLQDESIALLRVAHAYPEYSTCQLQAFNYDKYFEKYGEDDIALVRDEQAVVNVPREELDTKKRIDDALAQDDFSTARREAITFLQAHPTGFFAADVLFDKGYAEYMLEKYKTASNTFALFLDRYPFHPSAEGAQDWRDRAEDRLASNDA